ncbi:MAG: DUF6403 family protein [Nakamurella sp.]
MPMWLVWVIGVLVLVVAGMGSVVLAGNRTRRAGVEVAVSTARAAIASAQVSRDASSHDVPAADELLDRATLMLANDAGTDAADQAASLAGKADLLWQAGSE